MGCGASAEPKSVPSLLADVEAQLSRDPSALGDTELDAVRRIVRYRNCHLRHDASSTIVMESWQRITRGADVAVVGERVLDELLRIQPLAKVVFFGTSLDAQSAAIGRMLAQVLRIETESAALVPALLSLGARHALYGFEPDILKDMQVATMAALSDIGGGLTSDETEAWNGVWKIVIDLMTHGMNSPAGQANRERYETKAAREVQAMWNKIRLVQSEADEEKRLFTRYMYRVIIRQRPDFARFSNLTDFRTAERVMQMLSTVINNVVEDRDSTAMLRESGARHVAYEVTEADMLAFEGPFLETCEAYLGSEFTLPMRHLFSRFWNFVVDGMAVGMRDESDEDTAAPRGESFAIVFTDIEKSTRLWETYPAIMAGALDKHNRILRQLIQEFRGYEVKTIGDSFMIAFSSMTDAVLFAGSVQTELMTHSPIAPGFTMIGPTQGSGPAEVWDDTTLRVRVGVEWCEEATPQYDPVHRRYDYFGPSVNLASRVESAAGGGQVLCTARAVAQLQAEQKSKPSPSPREFLHLTDCDARPPLLNDSVAVQLVVRDAELKGVSEPLDLYSIMPMSLCKRTFDTARRVDATNSVAGSNLRASAAGLQRRASGHSAMGMFSTRSGRSVNSRK
uniref:Guanylate cyclase domain-containing protein n=1 Tax=Neobodo designis TaxID=312471 RepID=A0A7S1MRF1_NEODS|mmetsp:Transcript_45811/g.141147  ORF Transcript_45811/g.141147 Transcript_45811/m.141147 type:complete len:623 (+) Transcript_45811:28-1896(+)|eukprot:CAMPEP_0174851282 /NCGR_PEP_ID=MMETSP1114-20130205/22658_1 /TAXON_ID=312471 /ORGANISM="Neobodo designis, Strain CCAP 1951/1" /LENGTH=622 /DNA_ID=CAMNT_0016085805 /DNA_START=27 /DNA_END=1895 /DNA_ORIENTATION=+